MLNPHHRSAHLLNTPSIFLALKRLFSTRRYLFAPSFNTVKQGNMNFAPLNNLDLKILTSNLNLPKIQFLVLLLTCVSTMQTTHAASMGKMQLMSNLGEPFKADINVSHISTDEVETLKVKLASPEAYQKQGLEYPQALSTIKAVLVQRNGGKQATITLRATESTHEPIFDILLDLQSDKGNIVKKFTAFLDPPLSPVAINRTIAIDSPTLPVFMPLKDDILAVSSNTTAPNLTLKPSLQLDPSLARKSANTHAHNSIPLSRTQRKHILALTDPKAKNSKITDLTQDSTTSNNLDVLDNTADLDILQTLQTAEITSEKKPAKKTIKTASDSTQPSSIPAQSKVKTAKDTLSVSNTTLDKIDISQDTPQALATRLVKGGITDPVQIEALINALNIAKQNNAKSTVATTINTTNTNNTNTNNISNTGVGANTSNNPNITLSVPSATAPITATPPLNTEAPLITPAITAPVVSSTITSPTLVTPSNPTIDNTQENIIPQANWYDKVLNNTSLMLGLLLALACIALLPFIWSFYKRKQLQNKKNLAMRLNEEESNHSSAVDSEFPRFAYEGKSIEVSTGFISQIKPEEIKNNIKDSKNSKSSKQKPIEIPVNDTKIGTNDGKNELELLTNLVKNKPNDITAKVMLIKFLHKKNLRNQAYEHLEVVKELTNSQGSQWEEIAQIYQEYSDSNLKTGEFKQVQRNQNQAISNNPQIKPVIAPNASTKPIALNTKQHTKQQSDIPASILAKPAASIPKITAPALIDKHNLLNPSSTVSAAPAAINPLPETIQSLNFSVDKVIPPVEIKTPAFTSQSQNSSNSTVLDDLDSPPTLNFDLGNFTIFNALTESAPTAVSNNKTFVNNINNNTDSLDFVFDSAKTTNTRPRTVLDEDSSLLKDITNKDTITTTKVNTDVLDFLISSPPQTNIKT